MQTRYTKWTATTLVLLTILLVVIAHSLSSGEMEIPIGKIFKLFSLPQGSIEHTIVFSIRLPRIFLGLAVGGALSLAGAVLQAVFRNPLVEPYTLGISGGAAIGVAFVIVLGLQKTMGSFMLPLAGFVGALTTMVLVYLLSIKRGKIKVQNMLLIGVMVSFVASSTMMFLMATTNTENLHGIVFWIMGSLDETNTDLIKTMLVVSVLGFVASFLFAQPLNALRLGEEKARYLGVNTDTTIKVLFVVASLLAGISVSIVGVIGFVGLIVPHIMRLTVGTDYRILLPSSFISGAAFVVFCDTISRTIISPNELPVGVITGMIGGLVFIVVLSRFKTK